MNSKVDAFIDRETKWQAEFRKLRGILLSCPLEEDLKWGVPCYTFEKSNVVLMHGFKEYCGLLFVKGVLLKDTDGILVQQTENVQSARHVRFTNVQQVAAQEDILKRYILEAIEIQKAGLKVEFKPTEEFTMPEEFRNQLDENPYLLKAFEGLTPGRQRAYLLHFSSPKQSKTRADRVEKCIPRILAGKGLND